MEKIVVKFSACSSCLPSTKSVDVTLTMDENGKHYSVEKGWHFPLPDGLPESEQTLPKRVLRAFTGHAIDRILAADTIPENPGVCVLDGNSYDITITKGNVTKEYTADDTNIGYYPLLRYLASWYYNS